MRIADHAPVLQGSPLLQQPANAVHQQQIIAPEAAREAAAAEVRRRGEQVIESNPSEGRVIGEDAGRRTPNDKRGKSRAGTGEAEDAPVHSPPSVPGSGDLLDITI